MSNFALSIPPNNSISGMRLFMNIIKFAGLILLVLIWLWLCWSLIALTGGFTLKNILLIVASGIIIFVPIWKKHAGINNPD